MIEVVFIGDQGVGLDLFTDPAVAQLFAARMILNGFEVQVAIVVEPTQRMPWARQ